MKMFSVKILISLILIVISRTSRASDELTGDSDKNNCEFYLRDAMKNSPGNIFLFGATEEQHIKLNNKLIFWMEKLGLKTKTLNTGAYCTEYDDFTTTRLAAKYGNVINLWAEMVIPKDNEYFDKTFEGIKLIGRSHSHELVKEKVSVCKGTNKTTTIIDGTKYETCEEVGTVLYNQKVYVSIVSKKLIENKNVLLYILENIDNLDKDYNAYVKKYIKFISRGINLANDKMELLDHALDEVYILVCGTHNKPNPEDVFQIRNLDKRILYIDNCRNFNDISELHINIRGVVAAKPIENEVATYFFFIFYNSPRVTPEYRLTYPNSAVLFCNYFEFLKQGLIKLVLTRNWDRVAIVSDDSTNSIEFEGMLVDGFRKNAVICATKICTLNKCEFGEALKYYKDRDVRIIIANVEEKNVKKLMDTALDLGLTAKDGIMWIFRDLPFDIRGDLDNLQNTYIMSLAPETNSERGVDRTELNNIAAAVNAVSKSKLLEDERTLPMERIYMDPLCYYDNNNVIFQLEKISNKNRRHVAFSYSFNNTKAYSNNLEFIKIRSAVCSFWSHNFETCNDFFIIILSLVSLAFVLTFFIIIEFFTSFARYGSQYRHFS